MYSVIVYLTEKAEYYEFLEDSRRSARERAEEVAKDGFWIDGSDSVQFIPPSRINLIKVTRRRLSRAGDSHQD